ncbi:MAG: glycosyl transferase [Bacteroidales bacterium]
MLSICIPVYNYDVTAFVRDLHRQALLTGCPFEILLMDDASDAPYREVNRTVTELAYVRYIQLEKNIGRSKIRNRLAEDARHPYLLFTDCDSATASQSYIANYLPFCRPGVVCCGGRQYEAEKPAGDTFLRWKYGTARECAPACVRSRKANYGFCSNNFLIHQPLFRTTRFNEDLENCVHEDTLFGLELLINGTTIRHIDNPLIHLGLESAAVFLEKTESGMKNLLKIDAILREKYPEHIAHSRLTKTRNILQKWHLLPLVAAVFKIARPRMKKHLLGKNPSLRIFDLYKLGLIS